jgi:hypothetical protein
MLSVVLAALATAVLTYILTRGLEKTDRSQLSEPRDSMLTVGIQIICGDCSGENEIAFRTFLGHSGRCERCGGSSYVLASHVAMNAALARRFRYAGPRVLPFETRSTRMGHNEKVAV